MPVDVVAVAALAAAVVAVAVVAVLAVAVAPAVVALAFAVLAVAVAVGVVGGGTVLGGDVDAEADAGVAACFGGASGHAVGDGASAAGAIGVPRRRLRNKPDTPNAPTLDPGPRCSLTRIDSRIDCRHDPYVATCAWPRLHIPRKNRWWKSHHVEPWYSQTVQIVYGMATGWPL